MISAEDFKIEKIVLRDLLFQNEVLKDKIILKNIFLCTTVRNSLAQSCRCYKKYFRQKQIYIVSQDPLNVVVLYKLNQISQ